MRFRLYHLIMAAVLPVLVISTAILPVTATNFSITPLPARAVSPALASTAWPMFQHDTRHTGCSPYVGPQAANRKWVFPLAAGYTNSPSIASDGTLYACASDGGQQLYAINPDGTEKWANPTWHSMNSTPAVGSDGTIYVVQSDDLAAYSPNGTHKWSYAVTNPVATIYSSPAIGPDGTIYFTAGHRLFAIRDTGTAKWIQTVTGVFIESSPAIATSGPNAGTIYVGTFMWSEHGPSMLYAFTEAGGKKWEYDIVSHAYNTAPAIGADGTIYINSGDGRLVAITDTGSAGVDKWTSDFAIGGGNTLSSPAIGPDGTIYIGNNSAFPNSRFWAITDSGTDPNLKWVRKDVGYTYASAAIGADSTVYYQNHTGMFYALDGANDGAVKWSYDLGTSGNTAPAIDANGCVYVGTMNHNLYCFAPPAPTVASITPAKGTQGQVLTAVITGTNFFGRPTVSFSSAGISVNSITVNSLTQLTVNITVATSCAAGFSNVIVTTGGGTSALINGFRVISKPVETNNRLIEEGPGLGSSAGGSSTPPSPQPAIQLPNITVLAASLSDAKVSPGTPVTVTANILNRSTVPGSTRLTLFVNGQEESSQGISLNSGSNMSATFTVTRNEPGTYTVYVGGTSAGSFTVDQFAPETIPLISGAMVLFALIGCVIYMTRSKAVR